MLLKALWRRAQRACLFLLVSFISITTLAQQADAPVDVRLVIDVSGSMKGNDPNNLRQPAVDLLVELLPEESKAGVWTFGKWVNMLIPHKPVDDAWRNTARASSKKINSVGLYTNIGEALEKAAYDINYVDASTKKHIILLTDGMVDIDKNPKTNREEWRRIVDEVLPKLKAAGFSIHTIALSRNADKDLMDRLSVGTDGMADIAESADDLMKIFLNAFDAAVPSEQVALTDNAFVIDSSVEEFTALIFREQRDASTQLTTPDGQTWEHGANTSALKWHRTPNYDLITVKQPIEGEWGVIGDIAPDSRVTVVSNLNLRLGPLPNNVLKGEALDVLALLQEDGVTITNPDFLSLMDVTLELKAGNSFDALVSIWDQKVDAESPTEGRYLSTLPAFEKEGVYQLRLTVDGKTFTREVKHQITMRQNFSADVRASNDSGAVSYVLTVNAYMEGINYSKTQIIAAVTSPSGEQTVQPMAISELDTWRTSVVPDAEGTYSARIQVKGADLNGGYFTYELDPLSFNYSAQGGMTENKPVFTEPEPETTATPTPTPEPTPTPLPTPEPIVEEPTAEDTEPEMSKWMLYAALGVGNLLLIGLGYFAFKKIMSAPKDDILDELDQAAEDATSDVAKPEETGAAAEEEDDPEEEPPMEDLEAVDEPEPAPNIEPEPDFEPETLEPLETELDASELASEPEPELESLEPDLDTTVDEFEMSNEEAPDISEDLVAGLDDAEEEMDDLDAMAMEIAAETDEAGDTEGETDMAEEMLKAQGLDLAEDELDDAISSLIDDLEDDDEDKP